MTKCKPDALRSSCYKARCMDKAAQNGQKLNCNFYQGKETYNGVIMLDHQNWRFHGTHQAISLDPQLLASLGV